MLEAIYTKNIALQREMVDKFVHFATGRVLRGVALERIHASGMWQGQFVERDCESVYVYYLHGSRIFYNKEFCSDG